MSFEGVNINKGQGGLDRSGASTDAVMALVVIVANPLDNEYHKVYELNETADAEDLGFDAANDANEAILLHYHISEFFRLAPNGTLKLVITEAADAKHFFESADIKALFRANSDVKRIGFVYDKEIVGFSIDTEVGAAQVFIDELFEDKIYLNGIYLETRNTGKNAVSKRALGASKVSLIIAQDPGISILDAAYAKYAAVGSVLGMRAARKVNENLGSVDVINKPSLKKGDITYPLTDVSRELWLSAALSDGTAVSSISMADQKGLTTNAYIFAGGFQGFAGVYFNGEPTCILISSDYSTGENNGVWDKSAVAIRTALLPKVRGWFQRNAATGKLRDTAITDLENIGKKPLNKMVAAEEISGYTLVIPAGQNPNDQTPLKVKASITLGAIIHLFDVDLSLN
jgi:hypothetical protein